MALTDKLTAIANSIRSKTGGTEQLSLDGMATAINGITVGGGSDDTPKGLIERSITEVVVPNGATKIGKYAFYYYTGLKKITIPEGVKTIEANAFYDCTGLTEFISPNSLENIDNQAFYWCSGLTSILLNEGLTKIGANAFYDCYKLKSITIPSTVTSIGNGAFRGLKYATDVHIKSATPPTIMSDSFYNIKSTCIFYVPQGCLEAYQTATNWAQYADRMQEETS